MWLLQYTSISTLWWYGACRVCVCDHMYTYALRVNQVCLCDYIHTTSERMRVYCDNMAHDVVWIAWPVWWSLQKYTHRNAGRSRDSYDNLNIIISTKTEDIRIYVWIALARTPFVMVFRSKMKQREGGKVCDTVSVCVSFRLWVCISCLPLASWAIHENHIKQTWDHG